jgi:hypothetical protein
VLTLRNAWTLPQERWNVQWLQAQGLGVVLPGWGRVRAGVDTLLERLAALRAAVDRLPPNRALFEVPEILGRILEDGAAPHTRLRFASANAATMARA